MKAIRTRYMPATNHKSSYILATAEPHKQNRLAVNHHALDLDHEADEHHEAALMLCRKLSWPETIATGCLDAGDYVHVFI